MKKKPLRKKIGKSPKKALKRAIPKRKPKISKASPPPKKPALSLEFRTPREWRRTDFGLPADYGKDRLTLLVRDPWWIFAYWEVTPRREEEVWNLVRSRGSRGGQKVLRVYDVTDGDISRSRHFFDIEVQDSLGNWYVEVGAPDRAWVAEIGVRTDRGFFAFVRSNVVRTPRFGVSDVVDEEWMIPDELWQKIYGLQGDLRKGSSLLVQNLASSSRNI